MSSDTTQPPSTVETLLNSVSDRLQQIMLALPRFRPTEANSVQNDFDNLSKELLACIVDIAAAAAVDERALAFSQQQLEFRAQRELELQKLRQTADEVMRQPVYPFPQKGTA